jgi:DNA-binding MarR family transcriptional regulator
MSTLRSPWQDDGGLPPDLPLEDYPGTLLLRLAQAIQQEITSTYARANHVSIAEARLLARLHAEGPLQLGDLCRALAMDKAYASRILRSLQPQGFIEVAADPGHGRRLIVSITPAGRALARRLLASARERQQQLLRALDAKERSVLYTALKKLQAAVAAAPAPDTAPARRKP